MARYRKKPVVIEAVQYLSPDDPPPGVRIHWVEGRFPLAEIETLEGRMVASIGDWIIKGVKGEFYPCRDDIFHLTYEPETA